MILDAARLSLANLFAPETRSVFWKVLGLTILVLVGLWFALRGAFMAFLFSLADKLLSRYAGLGGVVCADLRDPCRYRPCAHAGAAICRR